MEVRRALKRLRPLIVLSACTGTVIVVRRSRRPADPERPAPAEDVPVRPPWIEPVNGTCPATHPIKVKTTSGIYHVPSGQFYARTRPERCYVDAAAAEADGYRAAKATKRSAATA